MNTTRALGTIVSGSLTEGFVMRIHHEHTDLEAIKTGKFVTIVGKQYKFFSLITDLSLHVSHPDILQYPPTDQEPLLASIIKQRDIYAQATLRPMLMLGADLRPVPVKTIPYLFAPVLEANASDVALIFGDEDAPSKRYFNIGTPVDMDTPVCIDLERLTERSNGIFGKTGTGKTFLTRLVLAGLIYHKRAVNVIFDMHSEYGLQARKEDNTNSFVKGLKTLFPGNVAIFSLDPESTRRRGGAPDVAVTLDYQSIHAEDIISLQHELNLHATAVEATYLLTARFKQDWLQMLLSQGDNLKDFAQSIGAHPESIAALYRKLKRIERLPFFKPRAGGLPSRPVRRSSESEVGSSGGSLGEGGSSGAKAGAYHDQSVIDQMMEYIDRGISIIIEFGNYTSTFAYLLVANIITRRIHAEYIAKTERFLGSQRKEDEPQKLMITIEEAHKFLNTQAARQTIFGTIAREMRKYYVSLLVVDQRPSEIDPDIISQIGTKIIAQLHDEQDIQAVLTGVSGATYLRTILASLDSKKQALLLGHALTMPIVVQTREYGEDFYRAMGGGVTTKVIDEFIAEMF